MACGLLAQFRRIGQNQLLKDKNRTTRRAFMYAKSEGHLLTSRILPHVSTELFSFFLAYPQSHFFSETGNSG